jgi:hypothetical protein
MRDRRRLAGSYYTADSNENSVPVSYGMPGNGGWKSLGRPGYPVGRCSRYVGIQGNCDKNTVTVGDIRSFGSIRQGFCRPDRSGGCP